MAEPLHFSNPKVQYQSIKHEIDQALLRVAESGWYILGEEVKKFEKDFAQYIGVSHCCGVANGTDALTLALRAAGVGPGDEVITVSHSAVATVAAIELAGATPVFADIETDTRGMKPEAISPLITKKTKAVIPVHVYGQPVRIKEIAEIAQRHALVLIEDCAQAHGAKVGNQRVGSFGNMACFSFYPTKNLGGLGDGGAVITNRAELDEKVRLLRQYGWRSHYKSEITGANSRLDEMQAAVLSTKLKHLDGWNERRRQIAGRYNQALAASKVATPPAVSGTEPVFHLYVVESDERDAFEQFLKQEQIIPGRHYPLAIHQQPAYAGRIKGEELLVNTARLYERITTLPMFPEMTEMQISRVCDALTEWSANK